MVVLNMVDLSLDNLSISSTSTEELGTSDEDTSSSDDCSSSSSDSTHHVHKSPFHVYYLREDILPRSACARQQGLESSCELTDDCGNVNSVKDQFSDFDGSSPVNIPSQSNRSARHGSLTMRECLLAEAWERKRELMLQEELSNLKERAKPQLLGRCTSDCGNPMRDTCNRAKSELLERSVSDCGKANKDPLLTPNRLRRTRTRSLTDDDFEELKGCIDLGFRFDHNSIPELCDTLPALEVYCAVAQSLQESSNSMSPATSATESPAQSSTPSPCPSWRIASPGDDPEDVKERLRHWAQAVACNARICY